MSQNSIIYQQRVCVPFWKQDGTHFVYTKQFNSGTFYNNLANLCVMADESSPKRHSEFVRYNWAKIRTTLDKSRSVVTRW